MDLKNKFIKTIIEHSCKIKKNDKVLLEVSAGIEESFLENLINTINEKGAYCQLELSNARLNALCESVADETYEKFLIESNIEKYKCCDVSIFMIRETNQFEKNIVPIKAQSHINKAQEKFCEYIERKRWLYLQFPSELDAHMNKMSSAEYEKFFYEVCTIDYAKLKQDMLPLKTIMDNAESVRICGNGTDISFSIKNMPSIICAGDLNIPDGEIYTAPIMESVNGVVSYNTPYIMGGEKFENIKLTVELGKIIKVECRDNAKLLEQLLSVDDGGLRFGEFALGVNKSITKPTGNTLFDEKIYGSFHLTAGACYEDADNGNKSCIHEDFVCIQTEEFGGGEIYFDDILIRKNGEFVLDELKKLNK